MNISGFLHNYNIVEKITSQDHDILVLSSIFVSCNAKVIARP